MGTQIVSTAQSGYGGRGGTCTGLVQLRRTTVFELLCRKISVGTGHAEYEEQGVQW